MIFVGYSQASNGFRLHDPDTKAITVSRDVVFDERFIGTSEGASTSEPITLFPPPAPQQPPLGPLQQPVSSLDHADSDDDSFRSADDAEDPPADIPPAAPCRERHVPGWLYSTVSSSGLTELPPPQEPGQPRRSARLRDRRQVFEGNEFVNFALMTRISSAPPEPSSVKEALESDSWKRAMLTKLDAIERNGTWKLVPRPVLF